MRPGRLWVISVLLFALPTSLTGQPSSGAFKSWFDARHSGRTTSHYRGKHIVVRPVVGKHRRPQHRPRNR